MSFTKDLHKSITDAARRPANDAGKWTQTKELLAATLGINAPKKIGVKEATELKNLRNRIYEVARSPVTLLVLVVANDQMYQAAQEWAEQELAGVPQIESFAICSEQQGRWTLAALWDGSDGTTGAKLSMHVPTLLVRRIRHSPTGELRAEAKESTPFETALTTLRELLPRMQDLTEFRQLLDARDDVLARYGSMFSRARLDELTEEAFRSFLTFKNNRHWRGLQRLGPKLCKDMNALREALDALLDQERDVAASIDQANERVPGLAQAVITPILLVAYPDRFGVWNSVVEAALKRLEVWPALRTQETLGNRYREVNSLLLRLAAGLDVDLWTLDAMLWGVEQLHQESSPDELPAFPKSRPVWVEVTSDTDGHGGPGWELGTCLWSPTKNRSGADRYSLMRSPATGDLVLHFVQVKKGAERVVLGYSRVSSPAEVVTSEPPQPGQWAGMAPYYRIELSEFTRLRRPVPVSAVIEEHGGELLGEADRGPHYPLQRYNDSLRTTTGQYLTQCTELLYRAIESTVRADTHSIEPIIDLGLVCDAFSNALADTGLVFGAEHGDLVRRFVCSLATKGLVILTGLSGSGKTQLASKFGEWLGQERFRLVPVRPDWTGPEFLLGYEDALRPLGPDGSRPWSVPEPLAFMLAAARDPAHPYLLVLDEMNLAHVERYFADVLSGMESRGAVLPNLEFDNATGAWLPAPDGDARIPFPRNMMIVGTVNVDETTYMFSPKVLDRASTLEFRVGTSSLADDPNDVRRPGTCKPGDEQLVRGFLSIALDDGWHTRNAPEFLRRFVSRLKQLHGMLVELGLEFGHRTFYEAIRLATMIAAAGQTTEDGALDLVVLQKVLPRIHGPRRQVEPVLVALGRFCLGSKVSERDFDPLTASAAASMPLAFDKIRRMTRTVRANQFVSFAE